MRCSAFVCGWIRYGVNHISRPPLRTTVSRDISSNIAMASSKVDVARVREDMLGQAGSVHLNSAGDSPMPRIVLDRVMEHLRTEAIVGGYEAAARCQAELERVYDSAALLINARADEIALQESATMAWTKAFYAMAQGFKAGDRILTGMVEYSANYVAMLQVSKRTGAMVEVVPSDKAGELDLQALEKMLESGGVKAVSLTHVPSNGGIINPAKEVGALCKRFGVLYILDACQSAGQIQLDVEELGCHVLAVTGRKFLRGPRGTGFLYISREAMNFIGEPPMIDHYCAPWVGSGRYELRPDARRFEFWESNVAGRLGLGVALRYALDIGIEHIQERVHYLAAELRRRLRKEQGVNVLDLGKPEHQCGIVSFSVTGVPSDEVKQGLEAQGIYTATSDPASTPLDASARELPTVLRASVHYFNNEEDLDKTIAALRGVIAGARAGIH